MHCLLPASGRSSNASRGLALFNRSALLLMQDSFFLVMCITVRCFFCVRRESGDGRCRVEELLLVFDRGGRIIVICMYALRCRFRDLNLAGK